MSFVEKNDRAFSGFIHRIWNRRGECGIGNLLCEGANGQISSEKNDCDLAFHGYNLSTITQAFRKLMGRPRLLEAQPQNRSWKPRKGKAFPLIGRRSREEGEGCRKSTAAGRNRPDRTLECSSARLSS